MSFLNCVNAIVLMDTREWTAVLLRPEAIPQHNSFKLSNMESPETALMQCTCSAEVSSFHFDGEQSNILLTIACHCAVVATRGFRV